MELKNLYSIPWPDPFVDKYKEAGYWQGKTLDSILSEAALKYTNKTALIDGEKRWTFSELLLKSRYLAGGLLKVGIKPGDKIVVQFPNKGEFLEILFALFIIGAIPITALPSHRYLEIEHFCSFSDAKAYIIADKVDNFDYRPLARRLIKEKAVQMVIVAGEEQEFYSLKSLYTKLDNFPIIAAQETALLLLSGGTTNLPKLIPRTHNDYLYSIVASAKICCLNTGSVYLAVLPVSHNFTLSSPGLLGILYSGGTVVMSPSGAPDIAFELIEKHNVTLTALVPPLAITWLNSVCLHNTDLTSLEVLQVGGSKLSPATAIKIEPTLKCKLQQVFGMAEGLVNYTRLQDPMDLIVNTQGKPISPGDEILIVDEEDNEVDIGKPGLLLTRGPYTIRGYYNAEEHNKEAFTSDGFYRTGDIVRITSSGYLIVEGRNKDQINRGGEKISVAEVENQLLKHPNILDAAVVAMPDSFLGEKSCVFVVPRNNAIRLRTIDVRNYLRNIGMAEYKIPDRLEVTDILPKTPLGKINKKLLRKIIASKLKYIDI